MAYKEGRGGGMPGGLMVGKEDRGLKEGGGEGGRGKWERCVNVCEHVSISSSYHQYNPVPGHTHTQTYTHQPSPRPCPV